MVRNGSEWLLLCRFFLSFHCGPQMGRPSQNQAVARICGGCCGKVTHLFRTRTMPDLSKSQPLPRHSGTWSLFHVRWPVSSCLSPPRAVTARLHRPTITPCRALSSSLKRFFGKRDLTLGLIILTVWKSGDRRTLGMTQPLPIMIPCTK